MDEATARMVLYAITGVGIVVWLAALRFFNSAYRSRRAHRELVVERFRLTEPPPENLIYGSTELDEEAAALAAKAASLLAGEKVGSIGQLKILQCTDDRIVFEPSPQDSPGGGSGQPVRRGQIQFTRLQNHRTRVEYGIEVSGGRGLLLGGAAFLILGVVALVIGFLLVNVYVVPNANPAIRHQTFQMAQVAHLLWPPFLFGGLYRRQYTAARASIDTFIHNLPYRAT